MTKYAESLKGNPDTAPRRPPRLARRPPVRPARVTADQKKAIEAGFQQARKEARSAADSGLIDINGWKLQTSLFYSENGYVLRAGAAEITWGSPKFDAPFFGPTKIYKQKTRQKAGSCIPKLKPGSASAQC